MNIVLLNPPGKKLYMRGYYCSQTSKAEYLPHPIDFIILGAYLNGAHSIHLVDAMKDRLSEAQCLSAIERHRPDAVLFLSGMVSWQEDIAFISRLKSLLKVQTIGVGDIFLESARDILVENPAIDAVLLDFSSTDILAYLDKRFDAITSMVFRRDGAVVERRAEPQKNACFSIPVPPHELFIDTSYTYPFVKRKKYASVLTDYGCPYGCSFCVMATLGYKYRPLENILPELDYLKRLGIREIFFVDQSFGVMRSRNSDLYREMKERRYGFGWVCYSRVDLVNEQILSVMKQAGCHTIMFGVESAIDEFLLKYKKGYTTAQIKEAFLLCRKLGIRTVGTFILGLPEDTRGTCLATIAFARQLRCDFVSFNFAFPRLGTPLRAQMLRDQLVDTGQISDQSGNDLSIRSHALSAREMAQIRDMAIRQFYMRPSYWMRQLLTTTTFDEACIKMKNAKGILANMVRPK